MIADPATIQSVLVALTAFSVALFLWAGWTDMQSMRIPNLVSLGLIGAYALRALLVPGTTDPLWDIGFALIVFLPFFGLYLIGDGAGFGAGDVKLITTGSLWFGWQSSTFDLHSIGAPAHAVLTTGAIFLACLAIAGFFQALYAVFRQKQINRRKASGKETPPGPVRRFFALFRPGEGRVYVTAALSVGMNSALTGAVRSAKRLTLVKEVEGKLRIPYGPSIVVGAFFAFWAQLYAWGIV